MRTLISRRTVVLLIGLSVFGVLLAACGTTQTKDPISLVPAKAEVVGTVDLPTVLADPDVEKAYEIIAGASSDPTPPATLNDLLTQAETKTGLDLSTFGKVLVFADIPATGSSSTAPQYAGFIAQGAPDGFYDKVKSTSQTDLTETQYKGVNVLESTAGTAVAVVDGNAVFGTTDAVHDVIDVSNGDAPALSGDLLAFENSLGDVWAKAAVTLPADLKSQIQGADTGSLGLPVDVSALLNVQAIGISVDKADSQATLKVVLRYSTADEASNAADVINSVLTLAKTFAGSNPTVQQLNDLNVTTNDTDVVISETKDVQQALDDLQTMVNTFGGVTGGAMPSIGSLGL